MKITSGFELQIFQKIKPVNKMENETVEINKEMAQEIFRMAGVEVPEEISDEAFLDAIFRIKNLMLQPAHNIEAPKENDATLQIDQNEAPKANAQAPSGPVSNNILVIDDIGVVTYQLKILFENLGYNVEIARDIFSGMNAFVKNNYAFVIMDLFVSTEQEGYTLLNETKKLITKNNLNTKIIVITASSKAENKVKCLNGGADIFLKKDTGWQDKLIEMIEDLHQ